MKLIIDGDSTPHKAAAIEAAEKCGVKTVIVMSLAHYSEKFNAAEVIYVDSEKQAADIKIANLCEAGDAVITSDTGLAYLLQGKGAVVITGRGKVLDSEDVEKRLNVAYITKKALRSKKGKRKVTGPAAHTKEDEARLMASITRVLSQKKAGN